MHRKHQQDKENRDRNQSLRSKLKSFKREFRQRVPLRSEQETK